MNHHSSQMLSAEKHYQPNPLLIQNQPTRGENSNEIHERNPTRIHAQSGSISISGGEQNPRPARQSVLGKRHVSDMPTDKRMSLERRNPLSRMSARDQQMLQPFEANTSQRPFQQMRPNPPSFVDVMNQLMSNSNQAAVPLAMSGGCQQPWHPQGSQRAQMVSQRSQFHDDHSAVNLVNSAVNLVNPTDMAGRSQHAVHLQPLSFQAQEEIMLQFQVQRAAQGLAQYSNNNDQSSLGAIAHQASVEQANDPVIGRLSSLVAVTQRRGLDKRKQPMPDPVPHQGVVSGKTNPLLAWRLHQSAATNQMMSHSSSSNLKSIQFVRGHGSTEARRTLELMTRAGDGMHECRIVYGDGTEGISCFTLPTNVQADIFTRQFTALMASEGFKLAAPQFDNFVEMVEERLLRLEISKSRQLDLASTHATVQEIMQPSSSQWRLRPQYVVMQLGLQTGNSQLAVSVDPQVGLFPSPSSWTLTQADLNFPWLLTIAGNPTLRVPVLVPYTSQPQYVTGPSGAPLATPIQLPPIPPNIVVPVPTPLIIPMRAAARLVTLAAGESNSGHLMQQLPWILSIN